MEKAGTGFAGQERRRRSILGPALRGGPVMRGMSRTVVISTTGRSLCRKPKESK